MLQINIFTVISNSALTECIYEMKLKGDVSSITSPGQFVNIKLEGLFLRRPISVCDLEGDVLTIIYKIVGKGTLKLSAMSCGDSVEIMTGLGNGYDTSLSGDAPLLIGGGVGVPPMYLLAKNLIDEGKKPSVIIGFNTDSEIFYKEKFEELGCRTTVTTADGSFGKKGFVTDAIPNGYTYIYCCGPEPMLRAVYKASNTSGQFSFEKRMGCGFGACMGCSCRTITGFKRICKEGPVLEKEEILWED